MTTTVVKTIGSGGDYSTLQSWEDATPPDLTTATGVDQIWQGQCLNTGTFTGTSGTLLSIAGTTTSAATYVELTTAPGAAWRDNANVQSNAYTWDSAVGVNISSSADYATIITCSVDFTRISNLQIKATAGHSGVLNMSLGGSGTATCDVNNCIIDGQYATVPGGGPLKMYGSNQVVRNSLIVQRGSGQPAIAIIQNGAKAYGCTFACTGAAAATVAVSGQYGAPTYENCGFFGCANVWSGGTTPTFTTCASDTVGTLPTGCTSVTWVASFVGADDFRLKSGSPLIDAGTTDATHLATDAAGTARPQGAAYDIGAWEFKAASSDVTVSITGQRATFSLGALGVAHTLALVGRQLTYTQGAVTVATQGDVTITLTGLGLALTQGALAGTVHMAVPSGLALTTTQGVVTSGSDKTVAIVGQKATTQAGMVSANTGSDVVVTLTGLKATTKQGPIATLHMVPMTGIVVDFQRGTLVATGGVPALWTNVANPTTDWTDAK